MPSFDVGSEQQQARIRATLGDRLTSVIASASSQQQRQRSDIVAVGVGEARHRAPRA
jgi:hypothetical protein